MKEREHDKDSVRWSVTAMWNVDDGDRKKQWLWSVKIFIYKEEN